MKIPSTRPWYWHALACLVAAGLALPEPAGAEAVKIGIRKLTTSGPVYIAQERGYFAAEGLDATLVDFDAAQPIAVATVSGAIDFGVTGLTAGFYALAGQGALRIVGAWARDVPSFQLQAIAVSNRAHDAGLVSLRDLPGHAVAISQIGSTFHYSLGLIAEKYGFDLAAIRLLPLQSNPNSVSAVGGGQADAALVPVTTVMPSLQRGDAIIDRRYVVPLPDP